MNPATVGASLDVTFNDVNGVGLRATSITDVDPEFDLLLNGGAATVTVNGAPSLVSGTTYRYALSAALTTGLWTVRFRQGAFSDNAGASSMGADQQFVVFVATPSAPKPGPVATVANPGGGATITAAQINAQGYVDITYSSLPATTGATPDPIIKSSLETSTAPFSITGTGVADLARDGSNVPTLLGSPLLISGFAATATSVTYRYFLKDANTANATGLFTAGNVTLTFIAGRVRSGVVGGSVAAGTIQVNAASTQSFTIDASAPGAKTTGGPVALGPLTLQGPSIGLGDFGFTKDGMVVMTITLGVDRATLAFGGSAANNSTTPNAQQTSSGVNVTLLGLQGSFGLKVDVLGLLSGTVRVAPTGKWSLRVASLTAEIPNVAILSATGVVIGYDPAAGIGQRLIVINSATIDLPRFNVRGSLSPYNPSTRSNITANNDDTLGTGVIPGLVIRDNGFDLGTAELSYGVAGASNSLQTTASDGKISFGGILVLDDIRVGVSGLSVTVGSAVDFSGQIYIASGGAKLFPGKAFSATLSDRQTADDVTATGTPDTEAFRIALTFSHGVVDAFQVNIDTMTVQLGSFVSLSARDFRLDTGAAGTTNRMISFQSVGARVAIASLVIGGEARNFGFLGDGTFVTDHGFGLSLSVGSATGDAFKFPSFMPIRIDAIGIEWADVTNNPGDFVLTLSASVTSIQGLAGVQISGSIQGIRIQPALLARGEFPIIGIDSLGVTVKGDLFGGTIDAGLVGGILKLDSSYQIIGTFDTTTPVFKRVFYLGLQGGFSISGLAGFTIRLGLSELGPLSVFINVELPTGIILVPQIGLTINDFSAGVEFFKTLPSIDDPMALRGSDFALPTNVSAATWLTSLQAQVAAQAAAIGANPNLSGFAAAFTAPMTITGAARIYSLFTSQEVFNGQVLVKISTDGKLLIVGTLNFAANNVSISGRLYVDLSKIASGSATVLFLADVPDQVRLLSIYGKLKMGFRDSSGNEVTFDTVDLPDPVATGTAPVVGVSGPAPSGGSVDVGTAAAQTYDFGSGAHHYLDISYAAPSGASLDIASIMGSGTAFTLTVNGVLLSTITSAPIPIVAVSLPDGVVFVPLVCTVAACTYRYRPTGAAADTVVTVVAQSSDPAHQIADLMAAAIRLTGTTRFRYDIGAAALPIGTVSLGFAAGAVKNADATTPSGTTTGAGNAATTLTFTVVGASGTIADPTPGGAVDVNLMNNRQWLTWLDVTFTPPTGRTIDVATLLDGTLKVTLSGAGLGTVAIDTTRAPIVITTNGTTGAVTLRFWITGAFAATGAVQVQGIDRSWSLAGATASGALSTVTLTAGSTPTTFTITFPAGFVIPAGYALAPSAFTDVDPLLAGIQLYSSGGWVVTIDLTRAITNSGLVFTVPVVVTAASSAATATFTPTLIAGATRIVSTTATDYTTTAAATAASPVAPIALTGTPTSYVDVTFIPTAGSTLNLGSINGDEILLGGPGAAGATLVPNTAIWLGGTTFRYLVTGSFVPGLVTVTIKLDAFSDNSGRSPPAGLTRTQSFTVTGVTVDAVRTVPTTNGDVVVGLAGSTVGADTLNALHYLEIRFRATSGNLIDAATIDGNEIELRDAAGTLVALGRPIRVGSSDIYRFPFTTNLVPGTYTITFLAGSVGDTGGRLNLAGTATFRVATPTAVLADPSPGSVLDAGDLNGRGYVDITFPAFDNNAVDVATLLDAGAEITITAANGATITVLGVPTVVDAAAGTYRYYFTGYTGGTLTVTFVAGSWANTSGTTWSAAAPKSFADPAVVTTLDQTHVDPQTWFDVVLTPLPGATVDVASVIAAAGSLLTLSGAGAEGLTFVGLQLVGNAPTAGAPARFRLVYSGTLSTGTVTATFRSGAWHDSAGNAAVTSASTFRLITRGSSFYIELSGGILLQAAGLTDEPLMDLRARVILEIDSARRVFTLTFDGQLSLIKLGTVGATSGRFVLDMGDPSSSAPQFWGVATLETNFSALQPLGISMFAKGTLQINTTGQVKNETLVLKGLGGGGSDLTRSFTLQPFSFGVALVGQLILSIPGTTTELFREQGGIFIAISGLPTPSLVMYLTGEVSIGSGNARLTFGAATAILFVSTDVLGGDVGVAGSITVSAGGGIGLPDLGALFSATGTVSLMLNTTLHEKTFIIPPDFLPLLHPGDPTSITVYASAPGLDGRPVPGAAPSIYVKATIQAQLTIGGIISLNGYLGITRAVDTTGTAYFRIDGALGGTIPFLGSVTSVINLAAYIGTTTGIVGRIQMTRASNSIPGVSLNGQFLLEINTFSTVQTIDTFAVNSTVINGQPRFGGFQRDAAGNLVVTQQTLSVTSGFFLEMYGELRILDVLVVTGDVRLTVSATQLELVVNGSMALSPLGSIDLVDSGFRIDGSGLVANVNLSVGGSFGGGIGLQFAATAQMMLNTTGRATTLGATTLDPGFRLHFNGSITFLGFASASGDVDLSITPAGFQVTFAVAFNLGGLVFRADGGAAIQSDGIALRLAVSAKADALVFSVDATGTLLLNTTGRTLIGVGAHTFALDLTGHVELLKILKLDAAMHLEVGRLRATDAPGSTLSAWYFQASAGVDFFGLARLSGSVFLNSQGSFDLRLSGFMRLGSDSFGLRGDFSVHVSSQFYANGSAGCTRSDGCYAFLLEGSASVRVRAFGITLVGLGISFSFGFDTRTADPTGRVKVQISVRISIDLGLFTISKTARFTIGYLQFPPPTYMAGDLGSAQAWSGGVLYLNVGSRATSRNIGVGDPDESMTVDQTGTSARGATIVVSAYGRSNTYTGVTSIRGDFGDGEDSLDVLASVAVPVFISGASGDKLYTYSGSGVGSVITGGSGNDIVSVDGSGGVVVDGGAGDDALVHTGTGAATFYGSAGNDTLNGSTVADILCGGDGNDRLGGLAGAYYGDGCTGSASAVPGDDTIVVVLDGNQAPVIDGGAGTDTLDATLSGGPDTLIVGTTGAGNLTLALNGLNRVATGIEVLDLHAGTGADTLTLADLASSGVTAVTLDLGLGAADAVTVLGGSGADAYLLTNDNRTGRPAGEVKVARTGRYTVWVDRAVRAEGDTLTVDATGGNDSVNASGMTGDTIALVLMGGLGDDTLTGSAYDDVLDGGHHDVLVGADGDDTMTGGLGTDTFYDGGGSDTLVETVTGDVAIDNNLFVVGTVSGSTDFAAGAVAENLKGIFETARITGTDGGHTYLVGDADGTVAVGSSPRAALAWTGDVTLNLAGNGNLVRVELTSATGARVHVNGVGTGNALQVWGTSLREDLVVDIASGRGRIRQISVGTAPSWTQSDLVVVDHTGVASVEIRTLDGGDRIAVRAITVPHTLWTGAGDDVVAVGSQAGVGATLTGWPNTAGVVSAIAAGLTVDGGSTGGLSGQDQLTVDDTADGAAIGLITATTVTGLGMAVGITYAAFEDLVVATGTGGDTVTVESTHGGPRRTTEVTTGSGERPRHHPVGRWPPHRGHRRRQRHGADELDGYRHRRHRHGIAGLVTLHAGTGSLDHLYVDDTATTTSTVGVLTGSTLTGLGITLGGSAPRPDLVQVVTVLGAADGRFTITIAGVGTTAELDFDATPATIRAALEALLGAGNVVVTGIGGRWLVTYTGALAGDAGWLKAITAVAGSATYPLRTSASATVVPTFTTSTDGLVAYDGFELMDLSQGSGADMLAILSTLVGTTVVNAGPGDDRVFVTSVGGTTSINGQGGNDWLVVNPNPPAAGTPNPMSGTTITLDGGAGSDYSVVGLYGNGDSRIDVVDTVADGATNVLVVNGTPGNDAFLMRATTTPVRGLVALLSAPNPSGLFTHAEKVTYTAGINGGVIVNGGAGDDSFALDDTASAMTVNGGSGNDHIRVGQLFTGYVPDSEFGVPAATFFSSTRGLLSAGVSFSATINGGSGDDTFEVFRNVAALQLNGDAGDDTFVIRSFVAESETSAVNGGVGHDLIQYATNAPVAIDGGDGYDTVIVIGTEFADSFVITADGVYGAGRFVSFVAVERLVVYGMEGDDTFSVQSTNASVETSIFGGLGSDTVHVAGTAPAVQSTDLLGHSGLVANSVESTVTGSAWVGIPTDGVGASIIDANSPAIAVDTGGSVVVAEGGSAVTIRIRPTLVPTANVTVTVVAPAVDPTSPSRSRALELSLDGVSWGTSVTLTLAAGSTAWQSFFVRAAADFSSEGDQAYPLQWLVRSAGAYDRLVLANTPVRVRDAQAVGVSVVTPDGGVTVIEPVATTGTGGTSADYTVRLDRAPLATTTVRLTATGGILLQLVGSSVAPAATLDLVFTTGDWTTARVIRVTAAYDTVVEGTSIATVAATATSGDTVTGSVTSGTGRTDELVAAGAPFVPNALRGYVVRIVSGTGAGQYRYIWANTANTIVVEGGWDVVPDATSTFVISGYSSPATAPTGTLVVSAVGSASTFTVTGVVLPTANGGLSGATVRVVNATGHASYRTIASNTATTITVTDPWGAGTIAIGTQIYLVGIPGVSVDPVAVVVHDANTPGVVVAESGGNTRLIEGATTGWGATDTYTVRLTMAPAAGETITVRIRALSTPTLDGSRVGVGCGLPTGCTGVWLTFIAGAGQTLLANGDLLLTFTSATWWIAQTVTLFAAANAIVEGQDLKAFPARERRVYPIQGPLTVSGGDDPNPPVQLSLDGYLPMLLPGESSGHPLPIGATTALAIEAAQVDRLIVHNEDSPAADTGTLTSTRITGLGMAGDHVVNGRLLPGGVTYSDFEDLTVLLGYGADTFTVESTHMGTTTIDAGAGADTVVVKTIAGHTRVLGGTGDDTFRVGSNGLLALLAAALMLDGGAGTDTAWVDDSADALDALGRLTQTTLTGLGMLPGAGLDPSGRPLDQLFAVDPKAGATTFTIALSQVVGGVLTGIGAVTFAAGATAEAIQAMLQLLLFPQSAGADPGVSITCGTQASTRCATSVYVWRTATGYLVGFRGEVNADPLHPVTIGLFAVGAGAAATDMTRRSGISYYGLETLNVLLGSGNDVLNVQGTLPLTNVTFGAGDDRAYVSSGAQVGLTERPQFLAGTLDAIAGTLNLAFGTGRNTLLVSDEGTATGDPNVLITDQAAAAQARDARLSSAGEIFIVGLAPAGISYSAAPTGTFADGIRIWSGAGADTITVNAVHNRAGVRETTWVNTGLGNDLVTVNLDETKGGFFVLDTQGPNTSVLPLVTPLTIGDEPTASTTVTQVTVNGTLLAVGRYVVTTGQNIVGLFDAVLPGAVITVTLDSVAVATARLTGTQAYDISSLGGAGSVVGYRVWVNGALVTATLTGSVLGFTAGTQRDGGASYVVVEVTRRRVETFTAPQLGGADNDTVNAQASTLPLVIFGGQGADTINGGQGGDIVFGDRGRVLWFVPGTVPLALLAGVELTAANLAALEAVAVAVSGHGGPGDTTDGVAGRLVGLAITVDPSVGSGDVITTGIGTDWVFGGAGDDTITTNRGESATNPDRQDIVLGDHGFVDTVLLDGAPASIDRIWSTDPTVGGNDTVTTGGSDDVVVGGVGNDTVIAGDGRNLVLGDNGRLTALLGEAARWSTLPMGVGRLETTNPTVGGSDTITTGTGADVVLGGQGGDTIDLGDGIDLALGDNGYVVWAAKAGALQVVLMTSTDDTVGGNDKVYARAGDDVIIGGTGDDAIDGGTGRDLVFGDNAAVDRTLSYGDVTSPRFRTLRRARPRSTARRSTPPAGPTSTPPGGSTPPARRPGPTSGSPCSTTPTSPARPPTATTTWPVARATT